MRIGIMGGTFDPVHEGHLSIARAAASQLELDRVLFIPTGSPHFKLGQKIAPAHDRMRMLGLAIAGDPMFELDEREVRRSGVTYTADTLEELTEAYPGSELFFIAGADSASTLPTWKRAEDIARLCTVVVAQRPGSSAQDAKDALESSSISFSAVYIDAPQVDVSSTRVREGIARGDGAEGLVPRDVTDYIQARSLYRD